MSRWSDVAVLVVALLLGPPVAFADPNTPVEELQLPVVDLLMGTADADGMAEVRDTTRGADVRLDATLLFGQDSAELRPWARRRLQQVATELRHRGAGRLRITGHTDDLGSATHGLTLSRQRAAAVAAALRAELPPDRYPFVVRGRGEADPVVPNDSEAHRRQNRRVEIIFVRAR